MAAVEHEVTIEITCTSLPGTHWGDRSPLHLGIQKDEELLEPAPADRESIVFRPVLRVRRHADGSASFLGPFTRGSRTERFIYLVWAIVEGTEPADRLGRVKVMLDHLEWSHVDKALTRREPLRVRLELTDAKGAPVCASVRPGAAAEWEI